MLESSAVLVGMKQHWDGTLLLGSLVSLGEGLPGWSSAEQRRVLPSAPVPTLLPAPSPPPQVLKLLLVAWDRRLIFAIGTSSTTGESDTVIWNEIHHKTEFGSNLTGHGYPDINYLDNVLAELAAQGITEESLAQEKD